MREILAGGEITYHGRIDLDERLNTIAGADLLVIPFHLRQRVFPGIPPLDPHKAAGESGHREARAAVRPEGDGGYGPLP